MLHSDSWRYSLTALRAVLRLPLSPIRVGMAFWPAVGLVFGGVSPSLATADEPPVAACPADRVAPLALPPLAATDVVAPGVELLGVGIGDVVGSAVIQDVHWLKDGAFLPARGDPSPTQAGSSIVGPRSFSVGTADLGSVLSLVVAYSRYIGDTLCGPALSSSGPVTVMAATAITAKQIRTVASGSTRKGAMLDIALKSSVRPTPDGTIKITWKGGSKSAALKASAKGKIRVSLPSLPVGMTAVKVKYADPRRRFVSSTTTIQLAVTASQSSLPGRATLAVSLLD
ncbi:MAG: hypothetical protein LBK59_12550 [Bifidobacteriaceae bacterium]|nr:hypothetical protein [Bifidobacteriaceae bacterium]